MSRENIKLVVVKVPEKIKTDFRMGLLKHNLNVQHTIGAFIDAFIAFDNGEKGYDWMKKIIVRAQALKKGVN